MSTGVAGFLTFIRGACSQKSRRHLGLLSAILFAAVYSGVIGVVSRSQQPLPPEITTPSLDVITRGPIGQVPWIIVYLDRHWMISVNLEAILAIIVLSMLIGLNVSCLLFIYSLRGLIGGFCLMGLSAIPSFFSIFSCCGGGIAMWVILATGLLPLFTSVILPLNKLFLLISVSLLTLNLWILYRGYRRGLGMTRSVSGNQQAGGRCCEG